MRHVLACLILALVSVPTARAQFFPPKHANIGPVVVDFGAVRMGQRVTTPVTVRNLTAGTITFSGGGFSANNDFFANAGTCGPSLASGGTCEFNYTFRPSNDDGVVMTASTTVGVTYLGTSQFVPLSFTGSGTPSLVDMTPRSIDFGSWLIGETATVPITVTNPTSDTVSFAGGGISGNGFSATGGTCGGSLAPGASCQFNYRFTPQQVGEVMGQTSLSVTTAAPAISQLYPIAVKGTGINSVGVVAITPIGFDFGEVRVGSRLQVPVNFTNLSAVQINYAGGGFSVDGSDGGAFSGQIGGGSGCTSSTADAGSTCSIIYRFGPKEVREHMAATAMGFSRPGASQNQPYNFTGRGVGTIGQVSPLAVDFGLIKLGTQHPAKVKVTNTTYLPLVNFIGGNVVSPFSSTNNCPVSLPVGDSCEFTFTFNANTGSVGPQTAQTSLSFTNTSGVQPIYTIQLSATGYDAVFVHGFEN